MESDNCNSFLELMRSAKALTASNRPLRMRIAFPEGVSDDLLLPQRVKGSESICGGIEYHIDCLATDAKLPLKQFIALPLELQFVTDRGGLRKVCGIVTEARAGHSDGGLASYQLTVRDALAIMEQRVNTRIFRNASEVDIVEHLLVEWRQKNGVIAAALDFEFDRLIFQHQYPKREFTKQHNESDAAFIRRLLRRRGIAWFFRQGRALGSAGKADNGGSGDSGAPVHTLVLFDDASSLRENCAGELRFHRDHATEQRDTVTGWDAIRTLRPSQVNCHSWNYKNPQGPQFMLTGARSAFDQGENGSALAACLTDYRVHVPHLGADHEDQALLGRLTLSRHDYETKCFHGRSSVRDATVGEWNRIVGHPEIDTHPAVECEFVITELFVTAENNIPPALERTVRSLFDLNLWSTSETFAQQAQQTGQRGAVRYGNRFTCVRRGIPIVPAFDSRTDVPMAQIESALVVGPAGEEIHCDNLGRIKLRFPGTRVEDHEYAAGAGASDTDGDSAWVRVASNSAGPKPGSVTQNGALALPRVGSEVLVGYLGGDPDKPVVLGQLYNGAAIPPGLNSVGGLPGNKCLSGIQTREVHGMRTNHLCFDDTPGEISVQLASEHGASELNLGRLTTVRHDGEGIPRGEGAELRSSKAVAVRGAQGVLISAGACTGGKGTQLAREELIGMVDVLKSVADQLSQLAVTHAGDDANSAHVNELIGMLKAWDSGKGGDVAGAPIIAASAPAAMVMASQESLTLGAANKVDVVCAGDTQLSAGRKLLMRATEGVSVFALRLGLKLIAATGHIRIQAHDGNVEVTALKRIKLTAGEGIDIEAPEVKVTAKGSRTDYGGGKILQQCSGDFAVKSARFIHTGPGDGNPTMVEFPKSSIETDERIVVTERQTGLPIKGQRYTATLEDGSVISGVTDEHGRTELFNGTDMGKVDLTFHID